MKALITTTLLSLFLIQPAHAAKKNASPKKPAEKQIKLTEEERKKVIEGRAIFDQSRDLPPPSKHMQDKMNSGQ